MATFTTLLDAALEPGKPIRSIDGLALRDNPIAITEGAAGAPKIQTAAIQDSAVTTAKLANDNVTTAKLAANEKMTTANVLAATAGASLNSVGTYAFAINNNSAISLTEGATTAGGNLRFASGGTARTGSYQFISGGPVGGTLTGTWRCMGRAEAFSSGEQSTVQSTLFLRIS